MWWLVGGCCLSMVIFITILVVATTMRSSRLSRMEEKYKEANGK